MSQNMKKVPMFEIENKTSAIGNFLKLVIPKIAV